MAELNGQIAKKLKITKNEESLTFKELFAEPNAQKVESLGSSNQKSFTMDATVAQHFKDRYLEIAKNKTYDHPEKYAVLEQQSSVKTNVPSELQPISDITTIDGADVYFPYSENFLTDNFQIDPSLDYTVSSNPIDNADENEGVVWNDFTQTWDYVLVDDNYAWDKPTFIITVDDGPTQQEITSKMINGIPTDFLPVIIEDSSDTNIPPLDDQPPFINPTPIEGSRVYYGRLHLEKQAEGLFDGGSEIVLIQPSVSPSLDVNGNLNTANVSINQLISLPKIKRGFIRRSHDNHSKTVWVGGTFTNEWKPINTNLPMVIYEYDRGGSLDITLPTIKFTIPIGGIPVEVSTPGTFKYSVPSRSNPYLVEDITRASYGQYRNIKNPGIDPGWYDGWRSWGFQATNVTLITEGNWIY